MKLSLLYLKIRYKGMFLTLYLLQDFIYFVITDISLYSGLLY